MPRAITARMTRSAVPMFDFMTCLLSFESLASGSNLCPEFAGPVVHDNRADRIGNRPQQQEMLAVGCDVVVGMPRGDGIVTLEEGLASHDGEPVLRAQRRRHELVVVPVVEPGAIGRPHRLDTAVNGYLLPCAALDHGANVDLKVTGL